MMAVICVSLAGGACSREEAPLDVADPEYTRVELAFDMGALQTRAGENQGNKIKDVTVWAYEVTSGTGASATVKEEPVGWATKTFDTPAETTTPSLYFELPYDALQARTYRVVAVLNKGEFGTITPSATNASAQVLSEDITYSNLMGTVFHTNKETMEATPSGIETMPVSHWNDFPIGAGIDDLTGLNAISMPVYRSLAKTTLKAQLSATSSSNAALCITRVEIHTGQSASAPTRGFMFSAVENLSKAVPNPAPQAFGYYGDLGMGEPKSIHLRNSGEDFNHVTITKPEPYTENFTEIGSTFLYENDRGMAYAPSTVSTTDPSGYGTGAYYMKISYEYGVSNGAGGVSAPKKTGVNYVPLPTIVRNRDYRVNATFEVSTAGQVLLAYSVEDWEDEDPTILDFTYPTFTIEAMKTYDHDGDAGTAEVGYYGEPTAYETTTGNKDDGAFAFKMQFTAPLGKTYTVTLQDLEGGGAFGVNIYKYDNIETTTTLLKDGDIPESSFTVDDANDYYIIKVYPTGSNIGGSCRVGITHQASWSSASEYLLINTTTGGTRWLQSGGDRHLIKVRQVEAPLGGGA